MGKMEIRKKSYTIRKRRNTKGTLLVFLLFFILFPYLFSLFCENEKKELEMEEIPGKIWVEEDNFWGSKRIEMEEYLIGMMLGTIPCEFEQETLKAQAIILRSHCVSLAKNKEGRKVVESEEIENYYFSKESFENEWGKEGENYYEKIKNAVEETEGMILLHKEEIIAPPFFLSGNGKTRSISDYPREKEELGYLKSVGCPKDIEAKDYSSYKEITEKEFKETIKRYFRKKDVKAGKIILYKDSCDYIKVVEIDNQQINGEDFRRLFHLNSSCFKIEKINHKIQFKTMGKGHGFGFSQFQANEMALEGKKSEEILNYFFQEIKLDKI